MKIKSNCLAAVPALLAFASCPANAAVVVNYGFNESATAFDSSIVSSLITVGQSSLASGPVGTAPESGWAANGVNNGTAVAATPQATLSFYGDLRTPATITFTLDKGYDLTNIQSLAGWGDSFLGSQVFSVSLKIGSSSTYTLLGNYSEPVYFGSTHTFNSADDGFSTLVSITNDSPGGVIASNVTGIRFTYTDPYPELSGNNGMVLRELSAFGIATVPEPTSFALAALGGLGVLTRRRRH